MDAALAGQGWKTFAQATNPRGSRELRHALGAPQPKPLQPFARASASQQRREDDRLRLSSLESQTQRPPSFLSKVTLRRIWRCGRGTRCMWQRDSLVKCYGTTSCVRSPCAAGKQPFGESTRFGEGSGFPVKPANESMHSEESRIRQAPHKNEISQQAKRTAFETCAHYVTHYNDVWRSSSTILLLGLSFPGGRTRLGGKQGCDKVRKNAAAPGAQEPTERGRVDAKCIVSKQKMRFGCGE